jgi:hypothetical protein
MKLELTIKRPGGTPVPMGDKNYHFAPEDAKNPDSPHTCDVDDDEHIATLLATGVYKLAGKKDAKAPAAPSAPAPSAPPALDPLAGLDDAGVRAYAKEHKLTVQGIGVLKGAKLREKVAAAATAKK